jgi:cell division protease FtsH
MSSRVGPVSYPDGEEPETFTGTRAYSDETARLIDEEVKRIADECLAEAKRLLTQHRSKLDVLARALLREDSLDEREILQVTGLDQPANPRQREQPVETRSPEPVGPRTS